MMYGSEVYGKTKIIELFNSYEGAVAGTLSVLISIFCWILPANTPIYLWHLLFVTVLILSIFWFLMIKVKSKFSSSQKTFKSTIISFDKSEQKILFSVNIDNISMPNAIFTLYKKQNGFEICAGFIQIIHIQENGLIQAKILHISDSIDIESLSRENILVRPIITDELFRFIEYY